MKDIDFDELDRAVNSVLGTNPDKDASQQVADTVPSDVSDREVAALNVPSSGAVQTKKEQVESAPHKKTLVQKRSSGRFMDVVHPSSDVKVHKKPAMVSRHSGTTVTPPESSPKNTAEKTAEYTPLLETEDDKGERDDNEALITHETVKDTSSTSPFGPSLVDTTDQGMIRDNATESSDDTDSLDQAAMELAGLGGVMKDTTGSVSLDAPLDTPFVNGSPVEKRPLGAFSVTETDASLLSDEAQNHLRESESPDGQEKPSVDEEMKHAMDAALAGGDSTVEATDAKTSISTGDIPLNEKEKRGADQENVESGEKGLHDDTQVTPDAASEVIPEELASDIIAIESREVDRHAEAMSAPAPSIGSIPQQYASKEVQRSEEVVPVFDTENYHTPIKHTEKKSGWSSVIIIVVFILVGAGLGAAVWYFDLLGYIL